MLQTFDVLLFEGKDWWPSRALEDLCDSPYCHVAIALVDPLYLGDDLHGEFIIESGEENTPGEETGGRLRWGVQIQRVSDAVDKYPGKVFRRRFHWANEPPSDVEKKLVELWSKTKNAPYDVNPIDLLEARFGLDFRSRHTDEFVCSTFAAFLLTTIGVLPEECNWDTLAPFDFAFNGRIDTLMKTHGVAYYDNVVYF